MTDFVAFLKGLDPDGVVEERSDGLWVASTGLDVTEMAKQMLSQEITLSTMTAIAREDGETDLIYHYRVGGTSINVKTITRGNRAASIAPVCPTANWIEREIHDLYAVEFVGHPNLARLVLPPQLAPGLFRESGPANPILS